MLRRNVRGGQFALAHLPDMYVAYTTEKKFAPLRRHFAKTRVGGGARVPLCANISVILYSGGMAICNWKLTVLTVGHLAACLRTWILYVLCGRRLFVF